MRREDVREVLDAMCAAVEDEDFNFKFKFNGTEEFVTPQKILEVYTKAWLEDHALEYIAENYDFTSDDEEHYTANSIKNIQAYEFYEDRRDSYPIDYVAINMKNGEHWPVCAHLWVGDQKRVVTFRDEDVDIIERLTRKDNEQWTYRDDLSILEEIENEEKFEMEDYTGLFSDEDENEIFEIIDNYTRKYIFDADNIAGYLNEWKENNTTKKADANG